MTGSSRPVRHRRRLGLAVVDGRSMLPTLRPGDRLLVMHGGRPVRGRLAVVRWPDGVLAVKRLGVRDADGWWVERDNPLEGVDSWTLGRPVAESDVLAVVLARVWPRPGRPADPAGPVGSGQPE